MNHNDPIGLNAFFTDIIITNRVFTFHNPNQYGGDGLKRCNQTPMTCGFAGGLLSFFTYPQKSPFPPLLIINNMRRGQVESDIVIRANRLATNNITFGSIPDRGIDGDSTHFPYDVSDSITIPITLSTRGRGGLNAKAVNFFAISRLNPILSPAPAYPLSLLFNNLRGVGRCNEFEELSSATDNSTDPFSIIHRGTGRFKSFFRCLGTSTHSYLNYGGGNEFNKNNKTKQIVNASTTLTWATFVPVFTFYSTVGSVVVSSGLVRYGSVRHGKAG